MSGDLDTAWAEVAAMAHEVTEREARLRNLGVPFPIAELIVALEGRVYELERRLDARDEYQREQRERRDPS